ncbi:MAG: hypothetical protein WC785_02600 [Tatlockia sp.]
MKPLKAGEPRCVKLALAMLRTPTTLEIPVYVVHGKKKGLPPCLSPQRFMGMR